MWKKYIAGVMIIGLVSGCSTLGRSALLGSSIGGALGGGLGFVTEQSVGSVLIGTAIGSAFGAGISILAHQNNKKAELLKEAAKQNDDRTENDPLLMKPEVRRMWINDRIDDDGRVFEEGHFKYIIDKNSVWSK